MPSRFIIVPSEAFDDTSGFEDVELQPISFPDSLYLDFDPSVSATITKDGSDLISNWRNAEGSEAMNTAFTGSNYPLWVDDVVNEYPAVTCNSGGAAIKSLYSSSDILHNLSTGYSFAAVVYPVNANTVIFGSSGTLTNSTSLFISGTTLTWRNASAESLNIGTITTGSWRLLIGTYSTSGNTCKLWENDTLLNSLSSSGTPLGLRKLGIGSNSAFFGELKVARFQFYNETLDDDQVEVVRSLLAARYAIT